MRLIDAPAFFSMKQESFAEKADFYSNCMCVYGHKARNKKLTLGRHMSGQKQLFVLIDQTDIYLARHIRDQGVIQRKLADGGNRTAGKCFNFLSLDWLKLPLTILRYTALYYPCLNYHLLLCYLWLILGTFIGLLLWSVCFT